MEERFLLAINRIEEISKEEILPLRIREYFKFEAEFILYAAKCREMVKNGSLKKLSLDELRAMNRRLYEPLPVDINNKQLKVLDAELHAMIPYAFEDNLRNVLIRAELFIEVYITYIFALSDAKEANLKFKAPDIKEILYYYVSDYTCEAYEEKVAEMVCTESNPLTGLLMENDFSDVRSLYFYGEYVTETEEKTLLYLNSISAEKLKKMADSYTEGYRIGFEVTGKELSKKKCVDIRYHLGFEPMIKLAVLNFRAMGLEPCIRRGHMNLLLGRGLNRIGIESTSVSKQYVFEHKDDEALIFDSRLKTVRLESLKKAFEKYKAEARLYAGPAVVEVFGEAPFEYKNVKSAPTYSKRQQALRLKYRSEAGLIQREYVIEEERSFTIIAFPTPEIGEDFEEIFDETVKINTLDYMLYRDVQQKIIDTLDLGDFVMIKGRGKNKTNLRVKLYELKEPSKETIFENCVADVNIPVGEVFTSPVLKGTDGVLCVKRVFLNGLEYRDLRIEVKDGRIVEYSCSNFETKEENDKYFKDNVLFGFDTLPMGEFAIGTNTTAYSMMRRFDIEEKMPILIAEKTGPHFAFGDTCYSHEEELITFNPDGKKIVARENECSLLRKSDPLKAYFNCHTDITLPYDEIGEISVVTKDNRVIPIIEEGLFVLEGTEALNAALR